MRSTFKILFYANKGKEKDGIVPIMGRITINGTQCQFSCKHSIPLAMWDVKGNCAKGRSKEAMQINRDLDNIKAQIIKHYQQLSDREAFVTAEMVRNSYQGFGSEYETLLNAFDKDIASLKKRVGKDRVASTLWAMQRSRKDVADFLQYNLRRTDISMLELAPEFIKDFAAYLSLLCCKSWAEFVNHLKANGVEVQLVMRRDGSKDLKVLQGMRFKKDG